MSPLKIFRPTGSRLPNLFSFGAVLEWICKLCCRLLAQPTRRLGIRRGAPERQLGMQTTGGGALPYKSRAMGEVALAADLMTGKAALAADLITATLNGPNKLLYKKSIEKLALCAVPFWAPGGVIMISNATAQVPSAIAAEDLALDLLKLLSEGSSLLETSLPAEAQQRLHAHQRSLA